MSAVVWMSDTMMKMKMMNSFVALETQATESEAQMIPSAVQSSVVDAQK